MKVTFNIIDWCARAPGLSECSQWQQWAQSGQAISADAPQAKVKVLPMMTARRLKSGSRLAAECALTLLARHQADALLFTSRHGELERNLSILQTLAKGQPVSPTDFALSVHNSAAGNVTIVRHCPLVCSALSAGIDTFQQGLYEAQCLFQGGYQRLLLVDFDGDLPAFYQPLVPEPVISRAYALALLIEAGERLCCQAQLKTSFVNPVNVMNAANPVSESLAQTSSALSQSLLSQRLLPQSLQFLRGWLSGLASFHIAGDRHCWRWSCQ